MNDNLQLMGLLLGLFIIAAVAAWAVRKCHKIPTLEDVRVGQLREAQVQALHWHAQAEAAKAQADMYEARIVRLGRADL